jgi:integration host factor subunit beta
MTRSELIARLSKRFPQYTHSDAELSVKCILDTLAERIALGNRMEIRDFGVFCINIRPPRIGRNPKTGERVEVPAKPAPHFKAGLELRERVKRS